MGWKWKPLILFHLRQGPSRFGQLKRLVHGISEKVLIQQLRELTEAGVLIRRDFREVPPKVEYEVTEFGSSLAAALKPLCVWGEQNRSTIAEMQIRDAGAASQTNSASREDA
ncbi:helix-turn-helix domain-containing protein [Paraburkholderia sp. BL18I3N2]|uniref:winged helix-turn-helix transcriptional regulator n=1 Tax=Paraburkholderia sp. BL18I3N2 TaxID=1938799 RepID=UPI000D052875|nr:helix-turn-helix domain-containing protein [Paraburkholderia sp. BL18I3N2]